MNSLEGRLQLGMVLSLALLMGALWMVGNQSIRSLTENFVISRLEHDAESLVAAMIIGTDTPRISWRRINQIYNQPFSGHYYLIQGAQGDRLVSRSLWDYPLDLPRLAPGETQRIRLLGPSDQQLLVLVEGFRKHGQDFTLAVAEDLSLIREQRDQFKRSFAVLALVGFLGLVLVQRLVIRHSFKRMEVVRRDIQRLEQGETERLSEDVPAEVQPLVQELNHLLTQLARRLEYSRNALGNLTHALKGPLNLLLQHFDDATAGTDQQKRRQAGLQTERIRQLMDRELKRARLAGNATSVKRFDPRVELPDLIGVLQQIHQHRSVVIKHEISADTPSFGDHEDMLELMGNLLDNACKWALSRVTCRVSGSRDIKILIEDDGAGLSDQGLEHLAQRGIRLDESVEGHGLGLAIAKDIVKLYGGSMQFDRSAELGGLRVTLTMPQNSTG